MSDSQILQPLINDFRQEYPLLERIVGKFGNKVTEESVPLLFSLVLAASAYKRPGACCFVFNQTLGTTPVIATLLGLGQLREDFQELVSRYAKTALQIGQRVQVKPNNYVFEYSGIWEEFPHLFRLKEIGNPQNSRSFPLTDILRLEPTDRLRPKGILKSDLGKRELSHLDKLIEINTSGNNSLFRNAVLLHMARSRFEKAIDQIQLAKIGEDDFYPLSKLLSWGSIDFNGELKPTDPYQVTGEPLIAVTSVSEDLAESTSLVERVSKIVLIDGANTLTKNLQAYDQITDCQRTVILGSPHETQALQILRDRECPIWHLSPEGALIGEQQKYNRSRLSMVGATICAAETRQRQHLAKEDCNDTAIEGVARYLESASDLMKSSGDELQNIVEVVSSLYGVLMECSECCFGVDEETKSRLRDATEKFDANSMWVGSDVCRELQQAIARLSDLTHSDRLGQNKVEKIIELLDQTDEEDWIIVARSPRTAETLSSRSNGLLTNTKVIPISSISSNCEYSGIIVPAWPNGERFNRLLAHAAAPKIRLFAYPFEAKWFNSYTCRENTVGRSNQSDLKSLSLVLNHPSSIVRSLLLIEGETTLPPKQNQIVKEIGDGGFSQRKPAPPRPQNSEDYRMARLVQFHGNCHTWLTEWAKLSKINALFERANTEKLILPSLTVSELLPEDFVLFRESGEKEWIRLIAEDLLGVEEYIQIRSIAELWKSPLRKIGNKTIVKNLLAKFGLFRTLPTISAWLDDVDHIGPQDFRDIEYIGKATNDQELISRQEDVKAAIAEIRRTHIAAGRQLTELLLAELDGKLIRLDEQPLQLDLGYGQASVVCVAMVNDESEECQSTSVNRLIWSF